MLTKVAIHLKYIFLVVFSLIIIWKVFDKTIVYLEILDYVPRYLTILYLEIVDSIHIIAVSFKCS